MNMATHSHNSRDDKSRYVNCKITILRPYSLHSLQAIDNDRYHNLAMHLMLLGNEVTLLVQDYSHGRSAHRSIVELAQIKQDLNYVRVISVPGYKTSLSLMRLASECIYAFKSFFLLLTLKPNIVLVGEPLFFVGWTALLFGFIFKSKIYADVIDSWPEALPLPKKDHLKLRKLYHFTLFPLFASRYIRFSLYERLYTVSQLYLCLFPEWRRHSVEVFYWCTRSKSLPICHREDVSIGKFNILYAGSFGKGYDIQTIIEAANFLHIYAPNRYVFHLAGGGEKASLLLSQSLPDNIFFYGFLSSASVGNLLESAHCVLLPYVKFSAVSMPIKFFDALAMGLPVISSLGLEAKRIIELNEIGVAYEAENPRDLVRAIVHLRHNFNTYLDRSLGYAASSQYMYDPDLVYAKFAQHLTSM
jgi:glycosyltransferase involved in cell wall biosynthesis